MFKSCFACFILLFVFVAAACTPTQPEVDAVSITPRPSPTPTAASLADLEGSEWELVSIDGNPPLEGSRITLTFADGNVGGYAGCNHYGGAYTLAEDGTFSMTELAITAMECTEPEGILVQETAYVQALAEAFQLTQSDDILMIETAVSQLIFAPISQFSVNPADLIGTKWQLARWGERDLLPNSQITLIFEDAQQVSGFAGCRHYEGSYFAEGDSIHFPSMRMIETDCDLGDAMLVQEGDFTTALSETAQYNLQNEQLELFTNPGERLQFVPLVVEQGPLQPLPTDLLNQTWILATVGDEADEMFLPNPPAWLYFTDYPDKDVEPGFTFEGFSGCHMLFGTYGAVDDLLSMNVEMSQQDCDDDLIAFENFMLDILHTQPIWEMTDASSENGRFLTLQHPDDPTRRLVFVLEETAVSRTPELTYETNAAGCGDIFVYKSNPNRNEYIVTWIVANAFDLSTTPTTIEIADHLETVNVRIDMYTHSAMKLGEFPYCNDVAPMAEPHTVWQAVSGSLTVTASTDDIGEPCASDPYEATILLENVVFALDDETIQLPTLTFENVRVGWCAG